MSFFKRKRTKDPEIYPDEIFLDSANAPGFDTQQFEGRIEKAINKKSFIGLGVFFLFVVISFSSRLAYLQIVRGEHYLNVSQRNTLRASPLFSNRGVIYDRNKEKLAWNGIDARQYVALNGFGHVLGYVGKPSENDLEENDNISTEAIIGKEGIEKRYQDFLFGKTGEKLVETNSKNEVISESVQKVPVDGENIHLAIDSRVQSEFYNIVNLLAKVHDYQGGAGVIMDINNGEILSLVNWPEYNSQIISDGEDSKTIRGYITNKYKPFLNRVVSGLYAPGSIIKPFISLAALNEGIIASDKKIFSSGSISIPNPYFPDKPSIFYDWKAHGWVDMKRAIAVSSDVYFYVIGGGFEDQKGLGIGKIGEYAKMFGYDSVTGIDLFGEQAGVIPGPQLKAKIVPTNPDWRLGDTYISSIGQGYFQVTPIEMVVQTAMIANNGKPIRPHLNLSALLPSDLEAKFPSADIPKDYYDIVKEGMRMAVLEGTASGLNVRSVKIAAKTGTAEVGAAKKYVNSWVIGFFPYENPRYAFAVVMERGPYDNHIGGVYVMRQLIDWMAVNTPEYLRSSQYPVR